jgi:hypothetical protein
VSRHRKFLKLSGVWIAIALCALIAAVASGCSTRNPRSPSAEQNQNLPAVWSLDDYLAQGGNDDPYMHGFYGPYDQFTIDPYWYAPFWYPVPARSFSGKWHHDVFAAFSGAVRRSSPKNQPRVENSLSGQERYENRYTRGSSSTRPPQSPSASNRSGLRGATPAFSP